MSSGGPVFGLASQATTYRLRVVLGNRPGSLGAVATAVGSIDGDISSVEVIERTVDHAVDELVVTLPPGRMVESLVTAVQSVAGARVEWTEPYYGALDLHGDIELIDAVAAAPERVLALAAEHLPTVLYATWAMVAERQPDGARVLHRSARAADGLGIDWLPLSEPARLHVDPPASGSAYSAAEVLVAPLGSPDVGLAVIRVGGPLFRDSELARFTHIVGVIASLAASQRGNSAR